MYLYGINVQASVELDKTFEGYTGIMTSLLVLSMLISAMSIAALTCCSHKCKEIKLFCCGFLLLVLFILSCIGADMLYNDFRQK